LDFSYFFKTKVFEERFLVFYKGLIEMQLQLRGAQNINIRGCFSQSKTLKEHPKLKGGVKYRNLVSL
jgi:hypothetical protein